MDCRCPEHSAEPPPQRVAFAVIGGVTVTRELNNGTIMCQLCFHYYWPCELYRDPDGDLHDACDACGRADAAIAHIAARAAVLGYDSWTAAVADQGPNPDFQILAELDVINRAAAERDHSRLHIGPLAIPGHQTQDPTT